MPDRFSFDRPWLQWSILALGLGLIGAEAVTMGVGVFSPNVSSQYRAVYLDQSQDCWLSPAEQSAAKADPFLAGLPAAIDPAQLDHRMQCALLPDWPTAQHRTPDGGVYSRADRVRIMLPVRPGETTVTLTLEGYAPPRIAEAVGRGPIKVEPWINGAEALPVKLTAGNAVRVTLPLPRSDRAHVVAITLEIPQPDWLHALNTSDDPQYVGVVLRGLDRS